MNFDRTSIDPLVAQAREAYEQQRIRECVALIKTILSADPENERANSLQSAIEMQINRDLQEARSLLQASHTGDDGHKRKAAEILVLKALDKNPANEEAIALLSQTRATSDDWAAPRSARATWNDPYGESEPREDLQFTVGTSSLGQRGNDAASFKFPVVLAVILAIAGVLAVGGYSFLKDRATGIRALVTPRHDSGIASGAQPDEPSVDVPPGKKPTDTGSSVKSTAGISSNTVPPTPAVPVRPTPEIDPARNPAPVNPEPVETGLLAVSSLIPADIYQDGKYLGSTPTTLKLPPGSQTLEYRHQDLRSLATYDIRPKETASTIVMFETVVQINARPWAQVFLDGSTKRALGQTPLSNVRVPIGGVLVFENPNFPSKNHRVTLEDTAIQVVFP